MVVLKIAQLFLSGDHEDVFPESPQTGSFFLKILGFLSNAICHPVFLGDQLVEPKLDMIVHLKASFLTRSPSM